MPTTQSCVILALDARLSDAAECLAKRLKARVISAPEQGYPITSKSLNRLLYEKLGLKSGRVFLFGPDGLALYFYGEQSMRLQVDFLASRISYRRLKGGGRGQMIARAVGLKAGKNPSVIDATAGLGTDAFILASLGCQVHLYERSPEISLLLESGMEKARQSNDDEISKILNRMHFQEGDAKALLRTLTNKPEVVYLDPMFPPRSKTALVKKEMRLVHDIVGHDPDSDALLPAALSAATGRVVVKRPRQAPDLAGLTPDFRQIGKTNRFDVYLTEAGV